jgi:hypothetical protein
LLIQAVFDRPVLKKPLTWRFLHGPENGFIAGRLAEFKMLGGAAGGTSVEGEGDGGGSGGEGRGA